MVEFDLGITNGGRRIEPGDRFNQGNAPFEGVILSGKPNNTAGSINDEGMEDIQVSTLLHYFFEGPKSYLIMVSIQRLKIYR